MKNAVFQAASPRQSLLGFPAQCPRWHSVVANATTEPQLASDELTELAVGDLDDVPQPRVGEI